VRDKDSNEFYGYVDTRPNFVFWGLIPDKAARIPHRIGRDHRTGNTAFEGIIDEVRIYKRALTADEIKARYEGKKPAKDIFTFDTGDGIYPSIMGTHKGEIKPSDNINVSKMYTYSCAGTGTHGIKLYDENDTLIAKGSWNGYIGDYHNIPYHNITQQYIT